MFLGDYLDPYPDEGITPDMAIDNFKELLKCKHDNWVFLLGNHDAGYAIGREICTSRMNYERYDEIRKLFWDNWFRIAQMVEANGKQFLLTHAGVHPLWIKNNQDVFMREDIDFIYKDWKWLNNIFDRRTRYTKAFKDHSYFRGGDLDVGSPLWCDVREQPLKSNFKETEVIQVFGHTMVEKPIHVNSIYEWYCLDTQRVYLLDEDGKIYDYLDGTEVGITTS